MIYIGGIHGVGKTTISSRIAEEANWKYISASGLLKKHKPQFDCKKNSETMLADVDIVLFGIQEIREYSKILFDGHFVLLSPTQELLKIKKSFFSSIPIEKIIILIDDPINIVKKLKERSDIILTKEFVEKFQKLEIEYSQMIAKELQIEHITLNTSEANSKRILNI